VPIFRGKNSIKSAHNLLFQRKLYDTQAFPKNDGMGPAQIVDFNFAERNHYGKVDRQHNPVYAKQEYIVPVYESNNNESTILLLDFVARQFNDFQQHYERACRMGLIRIDDTLLSIIKIQRGYLDPLILYRNYTDQIMTIYYNQFLSQRLKQVINFKDFLKFLPEFLKRMTSVSPITLSGFQRSTHSSIFCSGMAIDIGQIAFGDDGATQEQMLNNPSFQFYIKLAKQYGFSVNKRCPSVLICDLEGPGTAPYKGFYSLDTVESVFNTRFNKTLYKDMDEFKTLLIDYYNSFVSTYPISTSPITCSDKTTTEVISREYLPNEGISNNMNNIILHLYITIRNIEERLPYTEREIYNCYEMAKDLNKISEKSMLDYIDAQFRAKYNQKKGSLSFYKKKLEKKLDK
jgi:hypothetical protein